jgi:hypothetical protein
MSDTIAPRASIEEARTQLDALVADTARGALLLNGDAATTKQFNSLMAMVSEGGDHVDRAMSGALPDVPDSDLKHMSGVADMLAALGIRPEVVRSTLENQTITQAEFDATKAWQARAHRDQAWVKAYLEGSPDEAKQEMLCSVILSSPIKSEAS